MLCHFSPSWLTRVSKQAIHRHCRRREKRKGQFLPHKNNFLDGTCLRRLGRSAWILLSHPSCFMVVCRAHQRQLRKFCIWREISALTLMKTRTVQPHCSAGGCQHVRVTGGAPGAESGECRQAGSFPAHGPSGGCANAQTLTVNRTQDPPTPWADLMQQLCCEWWRHTFERERLSAKCSREKKWLEKQKKYSLTVFNFMVLLLGDVW